LAELRGLERERRLRCGRCGDDWAFPWLTCVYCGESKHQRLRALVPEHQAEARRIEVCLECRGVLKSVATLGALSHAEVLRTDGDTLGLDVAAVEGGYRRPSIAHPPIGLTLRGC
jgi:FdhE protein